MGEPCASAPTTPHLRPLAGSRPGHRRRRRDGPQQRRHRRAKHHTWRRLVRRRSARLRGGRRRHHPPAHGFLRQQPLQWRLVGVPWRLGRRHPPRRCRQRARHRHGDPGCQRPPAGRRRRRARQPVGRHRQPPGSRAGSGRPRVAESIRHAHRERRRGRGRRRPAVGRQPVDERRRDADRPRPPAAPPRWSPPATRISATGTWR
jgi:hypothetical protein